MAASTPERTALLADIASSTRMVVEQGDDTARRVLVRYVGILADAARDAGGEVANLLGDGVFCIFPGADAAAAAAAGAAMHEGVGAASARDRLARPLRVRIGFEHGPVVRSDEGWFSNTVRRASRVGALARAGQTLIARATLEVLSPRWQGASRFHDRRVLRGGSGEDELHELLWDASFTSVLEVTAGSRAAASDAPQVIGVDLACGEHLVRVDAARPRGEIGRDPACDLHVPTAGASRLHAIVEWNRGRVQVGDVSTNSTTLERAGHGVKRLHHESATLEGEGKLWLGGGPSGDVRPVIYRCVTG
ncbi:MAG: adenylate/guanylate cyclase domain-containing protein [Deltaproteobacteria bacterium]|nr:adenylate/guanylate cyclase domain-containing protein [Deltaproteobacteria bacterium]